MPRKKEVAGGWRIRLGGKGVRGGEGGEVEGREGGTAED